MLIYVNSNLITFPLNELVKAAAVKIKKEKLSSEDFNNSKLEKQLEMMDAKIVSPEFFREINKIRLDVNIGSLACLNTSHKTTVAGEPNSNRYPEIKNSYFYIGNKRIYFTIDIDEGTASLIPKIATEKNCYLREHRLMAATLFIDKNIKEGDIFLNYSLGEGRYDLKKDILPEYSFQLFTPILYLDIKKDENNSSSISKLDKALGK